YQLSYLGLYCLMYVLQPPATKIILTSFGQTVKLFFEKNILCLGMGIELKKYHTTLTTDLLCNETE
ncbi:MAG TPA: hypothetical protein H9912_08135, partial [Candidatus Eisenbergiella stercorigallinarum]|nr:hypothetical protein [Candidatus Eisenbergiella stercorigallinarum]